jgi:hypothetical protein
MRRRERRSRSKPSGLILGEQRQRIASRPCLAPRPRWRRRRPSPSFSAVFLAFCVVPHRPRPRAAGRRHKGSGRAPVNWPPYTHAASAEANPRRHGVAIVLCRPERAHSLRRPAWAIPCTRPTWPSTRPSPLFYRVKKFGAEPLQSRIDLTEERGTGLIVRAGHQAGQCGSSRVTEHELVG